MRLLGFDSDGPTTVVVIGADGRVLVLGVVAPDTDTGAAQELLATMRWPHGSAAVVGSAAGKADDRSPTEVAARLGALSSTVDGPTQATINRWVLEAAAQFRDAPIQTYVSVLVEHIVRARMAAAPGPRGSVR